MSSSNASYDAVVALIDAANAADPNTVNVAARSAPAELVYGQRMSATLTAMAPDASELLRIAVRGQHIERWRSPRADYPQGRAGYMMWRKDLKDFHARRLGEIMAAATYGADDIARVAALVRKERMKSDPESQILEDVACVVFLKYYLDDFVAKTEPDKLPRILAKTWSKMSDLGHSHALKLGLSPVILSLLEKGLAELRPAD